MAPFLLRSLRLIYAISFTATSSSSSSSLNAHLSSIRTSPSTNTPNCIISKTPNCLIQDCKELHQITVTYLRKSMSGARANKKTDVNAYLSAALTNKNTCLEGLESASGEFKPTLVNSVISAYQPVSNSLSILATSRSGGLQNRRRILCFPSWVSRRDRQILQGSNRLPWLQRREGLSDHSVTQYFFE